MTITVTPYDEHPDIHGQIGFSDRGEPLVGERLSIGPTGVRVNGKLVLVPTDPLLGSVHKFETPDHDVRYTRISIDVEGDA